MNEKEKEMLEMFVDNDNSVPFETRVKKIVDRYFRGRGITSDDSYIDVIRDGCRKLSYFKPEDVSDRIKVLFEHIPDYIKMHKTDNGYQITYPALAYTVFQPPESVCGDIKDIIESQEIKRGVFEVRRKVLSEAIKFYMALNEDRTEFIVDDSIPDGVLIGNRESYINYMRNKRPW